MLNLIPAPRGSVHMQEGSVKLPETVTISLGDFAPWCLEAFAARLDGHVETAENGFITLKKADIAKEGYKLTVTKEGITVEAADESGAVWALTTVTELTAEAKRCQSSPLKTHRTTVIAACRLTAPVISLRRTK